MSLPFGWSDRSNTLPPEQVKPGHSVGNVQVKAEVAIKSQSEIIDRNDAARLKALKSIEDMNNQLSSNTASFTNLPLGWESRNSCKTLEELKNNNYNTTSAAAAITIIESEKNNQTKIKPAKPFNRIGQQQQLNTTALSSSSSSSPSSPSSNQEKLQTDMMLLPNNLIDIKKIIENIEKNEQIDQFDQASIMKEALTQSLQHILPSFLSSINDNISNNMNVLNMKIDDLGQSMRDIENRVVRVEQNVKTLNNAMINHEKKLTEKIQDEQIKQTKN